MTPSARTDRRGEWIAASAVAFLFALAWFLAADGSALQSSSGAAATHEGSWLSDIVVGVLAALPVPWPLEILLVAFSAAALGVLLAWLYRRLIYNDWRPAEAVLFVAALASNSFVAAAVTSDHRIIPTMLACAAVIPAIRRLESVGDVQAEMSFGLVLPLLFLAGPATALLIPMLALFGSLSDPAARRGGIAFVAMFLVAIIPTLLVLTGLLGMLGVGEAARMVAEIYGPAFRPSVRTAAEASAFLTLFAYTVLPLATVIIAYFFHRDRRRQPWSAAAVLLLPAYLVAGAILFSWPIAASAPTVVFLGAAASWLSVARLTPVFRRSAIAAMALAAAVSWSVPALTAGPLAAIGTFLAGWSPSLSG